jgi:hypothetical protein
MRLFFCVEVLTARSARRERSGQSQTCGDGLPHREHNGVHWSINQICSGSHRCTRSFRTVEAEQYGTICLFSRHHSYLFLVARSRTLPRLNTPHAFSGHFVHHREALGALLLANSVKKIIECFPTVLSHAPTTGVVSHDDGHLVRVTAYHGRPFTVITPTDEEISRTELTRDPLQLIR